MSKPTILCIDDERNVLLTLRTQLMRYFPDHTIEIAESGSEALALVDELLAEGVEIPLVIADQIMPGMQGDALLIELHARYPHILKVMLTGQARAEDVGNVVNRGNLYRFMAKPWNEIDLQLTVTEALRRYQQEQQLTQTQLALEQANRELEAANADLEQQIQERTQQLRHNEQQFRFFVEHTPVGVAMFDRQMNYLVTSQRWLKDYHLEGQSILGKCHYDVFPGLNDGWREIHQQGLNGAVVRNEKDGYLRPDGTQEWVRWEVRPWYDDADTIGGIIILGEIITDRIRAEIALQESEERYRLLSEISPVGIFRNDLQGYCIYANTKTLEITGLSLKENLGNGWGKNLHPDDRDWMYTAWSNFVEQANLGHATEYKVEHRYLYPEGSLRWALAQAVPERNAAGELVGFIGSVIDITERKQAEIALQSLVEGTASVTGEDFFPVLTQQIAVALNVSHVLITGLVGDHLHSLAFYADEQTQDTIAYPMIHTPCEQAIRDGTYYCSSGIQARFPLAPDLARFETDSYLGIALQNTAGEAIGVLCIFNRTPIVNPQRAEGLLRIFGARVAAEIERLQVIEVIQQLNADLEQRVQQRTQELQKLAAVVENSTDLIGIASMTGESLYLNVAGQRLIGVTSTTLTGMPVTTFLSPEGLIRFEQEAMPVLMQQGYWRGESIFRHLQTGEDIIAEQTLFLIKDSQTNEPLWMAMISRDIRYRKRAEASLRDSEERFRATFEQAAVGIVQVNLEGQFIRMNQKFCDIVGYSEADLSQKIFGDITYPDDLAADNANVRRLLSGAASTFVLEKRYIHQNGSIVWVNLSVSLVRNGSGEPQYFIGVIEDISDRKLAEQKLQSERLRLQLALEAANMGTWESDMETGYWSERTEAIFGYAPGTFPGDREAFLKLVYPDDQERVFQALAHSFATQTPYNIEYRINRPDGELRWVAVNGKVGQNAAGRLRIVGVALDITDRKQAEESIRFSQEQLQLALEGSGDGLWDWNIATGEAYLSPRWLGMLGYESNELPGHVDTWDQLLHPEDKPQVMGVLKAHLQDNSIPYQAEYRARAKTGEWRWIANYGKVVAHDGVGAPVRMVGLQRDITDRKQAEIALHESQRFLQTVIDTFPLVVFWKDRQSVYLGCNQKSAIACGLDSPADIIGKTDYEMPWAETDADSYRADDRKVMDSGEAKLGIIETQVRADGSKVWIETNKLPLYNLNGEVIGILGTYQNITDRKKAEEDVRDSEERLRLALMAAKQGLYDLNLQTGEAIISPEYATMLGYDPSEFHETKAKWIERLHPDDLERVAGTYQAYVNGEIADYVVEFRQRTKKGDWKWILSLGKIVEWDEFGHPSRMLGTHTDISDRKQAEQQLQNLVEATAATTGQDFFPALVSHISKALNVAYALVTEAVDGKLQALAFWANGTLQPNFSSHPAKTPCEWALRDGKFYCEAFVQQRFPQDLDLVEMGAESYLGIVLQDSQGRAIGNLCILHTQRIPNPPQAENLLRVFAARAAAELERSRATQALEYVNRNLEVLVEQRTADLMQRSAQLEAINKELESFSYSVSHDLRAPLRHVNGFVNALQQRLQSHGALADPKVIHYLQVIENSSQKMAQLIDGLLSLSRLSRKPIAYDPVPLRELVDRAIALAQNQTEPTTPVEFVIGELPTVQGDAALLQQVLSNLIGNAVKFSRHNPAPSIEIGVSLEGAVFVKDNGVGFQMEYANKLFGAFQRLHAQTEFEGTGIGLAIVQRIIYRHGGTIWAESQPNQGATFYFTLGEKL